MLTFKLKIPLIPKSDTLGDEFAVTYDHQQQHIGRPKGLNTCCTEKLNKNYPMP